VCALLRRCLQTVFATTGDISYKVVVVDNNSPDDSVAMVEAEFPQVVVIANKDNAGYPVANNQGMVAVGVESDSPPRYVLLLNPDTEMPASTLQKSIAYMDNNPTVGVMGPKLTLPDGNLDMACRRAFPSPEVSVYRMLGLSRLFPKSPRFGQYNMTFLDENQLAEVDSVVGAFMLVRTTAIRQEGMLDERFWMYGEDLDWAKRIKDAGWKVIYNPNIHVLHVKRASSKQNPRAQFEFYRAMPIFYYKHYRQQTPYWLHAIIILGIAAKGGPKLWGELWAGEKILENPNL
jgi:GT2 family glycosyltransferase